MNLLIIGAPGVGKGTMSRYLVAHRKLVHVSTGDMLRQAIEEQTSVGKLAQSYMDNGQLVPDRIIHTIITERLSKNDIKRGFLFDGYPRNVSQAEDLDIILQDLNMKIDAVLNLQIGEDVLVKRITGRRTCPTCGAIYNIYYNPPKVGEVCDNCGDTLTTRKDDNIDSLKNRLSEFEKNTTPVIDYYSQRGLVYNFNGDQDRESVFNDMQKVLEGLK